VKKKKRGYLTKERQGGCPELTKKKGGGLKKKTGARIVGLPIDGQKTFALNEVAAIQNVKRGALPKRSFMKGKNRRGWCLFFNYQTKAKKWGGIRLEIERGRHQKSGWRRKKVRGPKGDKGKSKPIRGDTSSGENRIPAAIFHKSDGGKAVKTTRDRRGK